MLSMIGNFNATLAARYGIVQQCEPEDSRLSVLGLHSSYTDAVTTPVKRGELTYDVKRRICRLACRRIGLPEPRFNRSRTDMYERSMSRGRARAA